MNLEEWAKQQIQLKEADNSFSEELTWIKDDKLRGLVEICLNKYVPEYFWTIPASSTGKYHPAYSLGEGGLVRHTKAAVKIANDLLQLEQNKSLAYFKDQIITALILHDTVKSGLQGGYTVSEHPLLAADLFKRANKENGETVSPIDEAVICDMIKSHMGQWNTAFRSNAEILPKPKSELQKFVHLCDYLASRKWLTVELEG